MSMNAAFVLNSSHTLQCWLLGKAQKYVAWLFRSAWFASRRSLLSACFLFAPIRGTLFVCMKSFHVCIPCFHRVISVFSPILGRWQNVFRSILVL